MGPPGYRSVMRSLTHGVRQLAGMAVPTRPALCRARQRLGSKPFELLFDLVRGPRAAAGAAGAFAFGLRVVAWDGTAIDVPGTAANVTASGGPAGGGPQLRVMMLIECGTHAIIDAALGATVTTGGRHEHAPSSPGHRTTEIANHPSRLPPARASGGKGPSSITTRQSHAVAHDFSFEQAAACAR